MHRCSRIVEYRGMCKVLRHDSVALVAHEEMFFVSEKIWIIWMKGYS